MNHEVLALGWKDPTRSQSLLSAPQRRPANHEASYELQIQRS